MKNPLIKSLIYLFFLVVLLGPTLSWADPDSISICDDPNQPHNAIWQKYCGGNGNNSGNAQPSGSSQAQLEQNRLISEARDLNQKGMEAYQNEAFDTAAVYFKQALDKTPNDTAIQQNLQNANDKVDAINKFKRDQNEALNDLKGVSGDSDTGLKGGDSAGNDSVLKEIGPLGNDAGLKDAPNSPPKFKKKKTQKKIFKMSKGCRCGGLECHCVYPLCGGTRKCDCAGVDCSCPKSVCKFAGTFNPCDGTVEDPGRGSGKVQRCRATCGCGYAKGECKCSVDCKCARKEK